jgi:hypothetical protein
MSIAQSRTSPVMKSDILACRIAIASDEGAPWSMPGHSV